MRALRHLCLAALLTAAPACDRADEPAPTPAAEAAPAPLADPAPPAAEPPPPAPQPPPPSLALQIDGAERLVGTPFVFTLTLSAAEDAPVTRIQDWMAQVALEDSETGSPLAWATVPLGAPRAWSVAAPEQDLPEADARNAVLDATRLYEAELGVAPEAASGIAPGSHSVRAVLASDAGEARSEPVTVVVLAASAATPELERMRRVATLRFALRAGRTQEAERLARELVAAEPAALESHLLLGDALAALGRDREALASYQAALARATPAGPKGEAPLRLLARLSELESRLDADAAPAGEPAAEPALSP